mgnify:CR=1 FL=1
MPAITEPYGLSPHPDDATFDATKAERHRNRHQGGHRPSGASMFEERYPKTATDKSPEENPR